MGAGSGSQETPAVSVPAFARVADGWRSLADQAGALREELSDVREDGQVSDDSLLSNTAQDYIEVAAAATSDIQTLAPVIPEELRQHVEDADPMLDDDVAAWVSDECPFPRLVQLGPVTASAHGTVVPSVAKRQPYCRTARLPCAAPER